MAARAKVLSIVLAGGEGKRLMPLTMDRAKPAVPFGGTYRLIDYVLSNLVNAVCHDKYSQQYLCRNRTGIGSTRHEVLRQSERYQEFEVLTSVHYLTMMIAIAVIYSVKARSPMRTWSGVLALPRNPSARISPSSYSCTYGAKNVYPSI